VNRSTLKRCVWVLGLAVAAQSVAADDPLVKLIDLSKKVKADPGSMAKQFSVENGKTYYLDRGKKRRLMKPVANQDAVVKVQRQRIMEASKGFAVDQDSADDDADAQVESVPLPKAIKKYRDYFDPRGSKGKGPDARVDHTEAMTAVRNQGDRGTCAAFASTAALESMSGEVLSPEYAYWLYQGKSSSVVCDDPGTNLEEMANVLRKEGIANDFFWGYQDDCPRQDAPQDARNHASVKARHVYYVPRQRSAAPLYSAAINDPRFIEAAIAAGYNIIGGFDVAWSGDATDGKVTDVVLDGAGNPVRGTGARCFLEKDGAHDCKAVHGVPQDCNAPKLGSEGKCGFGGHAMLVMGYERDAKKYKDVGGGYILLKNSWGEDNGGKGYVKLSYDYVRAYADSGVILAGGVRVADGGKCNDHIQCANFDALGKKGSACCKSGSGLGVCEPTLRDWAGVYYCEAECVGKAGGKPGTCEELKEDGEECEANDECAGFKGAGQPGSSCCGGECTAMQIDFAGVAYCPNECVGKAGGKAGTCGDRAKNGDSCKEHSDCEGFKGLGKKGSGCCNGKCASLLQDWAGVYYCKDQCVGSLGGKAGSCAKKGGKNAKCDKDADCKSKYSCCSGKCKKKLNDWAGVKYCPSECVGKFGGKKGTCD
jgi:hypothetical protein